MDFNALKKDLAAETDNNTGGRSFGAAAKDSSRMHETYQMLEEIGSGAYGTVTKARHKQRAGLYAIKHIDKKTAGAKGLSEVMNEVETLSLLHHQHIVHLEDVYQDDNNLWIVMDYVPGGELHAALRKHGRFTETAVRRLAINLLLAVEYIHGKGIVHRDLKPANCLLSELGDMELKIADFGFAVMVGDNLCLTSFCGTMAYMAPEVVMDRNYGKPVDMWAVGVIIYLLLCGDYPFKESASQSLGEVICAGKLSFAGGMWNEVSVGAKDFITRLLMLDAAKRMTATEALRHHWVRAGMSSNHSSFAVEEDPNEADSPQTQAKAHKAKLDARRKRLWLFLRAGAMVVIAAHRLVYAVKLNSLRRDGCDLPVLRSFSYLVGRRYDPPSQSIMARGLCVGNVRALTHLVGLLEASETVELLDLSYNHIDNLDAIQLVAKVATNHPSLTSLNLEGNPIPPLAGRTLQRLARSAPKLRSINVGNTTLGADMIAQLVQAHKEADKRRQETASLNVSSGQPRQRNAVSPSSGAARPLSFGAPMPSRTNLAKPAGTGGTASRQGSRK